MIGLIPAISRFLKCEPEELTACLRKVKNRVRVENFLQSQLILAKRINPTDYGYPSAVNVQRITMKLNSWTAKSWDGTPVRLFYARNGYELKHPEMPLVVQVRNGVTTYFPLEVLDIFETADADSLSGCLKGSGPDCPENRKNEFARVFPTILN